VKCITVHRVLGYGGNSGSETHRQGANCRTHGDHSRAAITKILPSRSACRSQRCVGIAMEDEMWIGARARTLDSVTIAPGCVTGAGAIVTQNTEPFGIYIGNLREKFAAAKAYANRFANYSPTRKISIFVALFRQLSVFGSFVSIILTVTFRGARSKAHKSPASRR
jgi:hypothetical protein